MANKKQVRIRKDDKNFRRDVSIAKMQYRKKRVSWFILASTIILIALCVRIYIFSQEKSELQATVASQEQEMTKLSKENKVNEVIIHKLRDPYFITELVRQEYSMSYSGELIFNIPFQDNFVEREIKSIMEKDIDKQLSDIDSTKLIIDKNLADLSKNLADAKKKIEEENARREKELVARTGQ